MTEYKVITEGLVNVFITSNCNSFTSEKRFAKDITVADLKNKLELITGASALSMRISAFDQKDNKICELLDPSALLGSYPVDSGMRLHVLDPNHNRDEFEDTSNVQKFELSQEEYSKRTDTVQNYLKRNNLGKYNKQEMQKLEAEKTKMLEIEKDLAKKMTIGDRCQTKVAGAMPRRGTVRYVGEFKKPGYWVGIEYDEPVGKNNGTIEGKKYFECKDKYGGFVKISVVEVGDFPEESLESDDEI